MATKGDPEHARSINIALILNLLKAQDTLSRAQLAKHLNLSKMTVSTIITGLINDGLIVEIGEGDVNSHGGRKPILLQLSKKQKYVIGIDVGRTNIVIAIGGLSCEIFLQRRVATDPDHSLESILRQLNFLVNDLINSSGIEKSKFIGIGFSIGGLINKDKGHIDSSPDFEWEDVPMQRLLEDMFTLPVVIDNCTRVMALGEMWKGSARQTPDLFYVNVGFGLGSAIVINNSIYENYSEFGHIHITRKPIRCDCGNYGCLEAVASGQAIDREANLKLKKDEGQVLTGKDAYEAAVNGDDEAKKIFDNVGRYLGRALSYVANIFHPEKIIIGGGVSNAGDLIYRPLEKEFLSHMMDALKGSITIEFSSLGDDAGIFGAVSLALDTFVFHSKLAR